jgi:hypothetical protein
MLSISRLGAYHSVGRGGASGIVSVRCGDYYAFPGRIRWEESAYPSRKGFYDSETQAP